MSGWASTYSSGTVSIGAGGTTVVGAGTLWSILADQANLLIVNGQTALVDEVTDDTHLEVFAQWGAAVAGADYVLVQFPLASLMAARQLRDVLAELDNAGTIYYVPPGQAAPDDEVGKDGDFAEQLDPYKRWVKLLGHWELQPAAATFHTITTLTGAAQTYSGLTHAVNFIVRTNAGGAFNGAMRDVLPGTTPGVLPDDTIVEVANDDATGLLEVRPGAGATLDGLAQKFVILGPRQRAIFVSTGTGYRTKSVPDRVRIARGATTTIYCAATGGSTDNSGITSAVPLPGRQFAADFVWGNFDFNIAQLVLKHAAGTYTDTGVQLRGRPPGIGNSSGTLPFAHAFLMEGDQTTPANCKLVVTGSAFTFVNNVTVKIAGFEIVSATVHGINCGSPGTVIGIGNMIYGACAAGDHIRIGDGAFAHYDTGTEITGSALSHKHCFNGGELQNNVPGGAGNTVISAATSFTAGFVLLETDGLLIEGGHTYSGTPPTSTPRWIEQFDGKIGANGRVFDTVFPGSTGGVNKNITNLPAGGALLDAYVFPYSTGAGGVLKGLLSTLRDFILSTAPRPTRTVLNSGTALNYSPPAGCTWIEVEQVGGGGGGGGGGGTGRTNGTNGADTIFSTFIAGGGTFGPSGNGGSGGAASGGQVNITGNGGLLIATLSTGCIGGQGASSYFGGGGTGGGLASAGGAGATNSGGGGGGGGSTFSNSTGGGGGGSGGYARSIIVNPVGPYGYTVGAGGTGGAGGTSGFAGGAGAAGKIIITEHYGP